MERAEPGAGTPELVEYADGFVAWLGRLGYSPRTCGAQVGLLRHLARWLAERGVPLSGLSGEVAGEYATVRRERSRLRSERALRPVLSYLRELGAVPAAAALVPQEPVDVLLARFGGWLSRERGLAPATVASYLHQARPFADACAGQLGVLTAARVSAGATAGAAGLRPRSVQVRANAVRALLRFAWLEGLTAVPLAGFVGSFAAPAGPGSSRCTPPRPPRSPATCRSGPGTPLTTPAPCSSATAATASTATWPARSSGHSRPAAAWHPSPAAGSRDCTTSATPSRSAPSSTRTARAATSMRASRCWPPISGTSPRLTPTGT